MVFYMLPHPVGAIDTDRDLMAFFVCRPCCPKSLELQISQLVLFLLRRSGGCMSRVCCGRCLVVVAVCVACCVHVVVFFLLVHVPACFVCVIFVPCLSRSVLLRFVWLMLVLPTSGPSSPSFSLSLSFFLSFSLFLSLSLSQHWVWIYQTNRETHGLRP